MAADNTIDLEEFVINPKLFMNRSVALYGASDSGKSTIIKDFLFHLKNMISQIFVFAPSDPANGDYTESGTIPKPLVHYTLDEKILTKIWKRQEVLASVYKRANKISTLESLFNKLKLDNVVRMLEAAKKSMDSKKDDIKDQYLDRNIRLKKMKELDKLFEDMKLIVYKQYICNNTGTLSKMHLTEEESYALNYISFNPRTVIIFDDCVSEFKKLKKQKCNVLDEILYRGRHLFITSFFAFQDDKNLESELRKNIFINIYTTQQCAMAYFTRSANSFDKDTMKKADALSKNIFDVDNQKLIYIRKENKFYKFTATLHEAFEFGSPIIRYFCEKIQNDGISISSDNMFIQYFK